MVKPGYKQTEVGIIPNEWEVDKIKNLASITTGSRNTQDRKSDGKYPFFVRSQTVERINTFSFNGEAVLTAGDGVGTGKVFHYINGKFDYHQRVYKISNFKTEFDGYYFYQYFSSCFYNRIISMTAKSSVDSVRMEMIADMIVPLPKIEEQHAIAGALSDVDALIASLDKLISKKSAIKTATMQQLLTGKKRLPGFVDKWKKLKFGKIVEKIVGGGTPSRARLDFWGGNIPWATVKDFASFNPFQTQEFITIDGLKNSSTNLIPAGTIITSTRMALGKVIIYQVNTCINQDLKAIFLKKDVYTRFVYYWFQQHVELIETLGSGSTVKGISLIDLRSINFNLPILEEQQAIAKVLYDMDEEIEALEARREKTRAIKQGMMQELLTGRTRLI